MPATHVDIKQLQAPLRERYSEDPTSAPTVLRVHRVATDLTDPLHGATATEELPDTVWRLGAHPAVGGVGDVPCSGDLLLAALVACQDITLRMVAANLGIPLASVEIEAEADWDPRGTLAMGKDFPVGITAIRCHTTVRLEGDQKADRAERLLRSAERYCVVLNTLREGIDVTSTFEVDGMEEDPPTSV